MRDMKEIILDEEFKHLMPPLGGEAYTQLTENLLKNGCLHALVLWKGILIDGYNRYEICSRHNIPYETVNMELPSREAAKLWIIELQAGRRNMTPTQLAYLRGCHYRTIKKLESSVNNSTSSQLAEMYRVSKGTILRDSKVSEAIDAIGDVSQEAKKTLLADEIKIEKKTLERLASAPSDEIAEIAESIENGTYKKPAESTTRPGASADVAALRTGLSGASLSAYVSSKSTHPLVDKITGQSFTDLINACNSKSSEIIKKALRAHIGALEEIFVSL